MSRLETMNRRGVREHCRGIADWKPKNSASADREFHGFLRLAQLDVARDAPFLFGEHIIQVPVFEDVVPQIATDLLMATADPWVLEMMLPATDPGVTPWEADVDWDGRTIQLRSPDDLQWRALTIREAWIAGTRRFVSLTQPYATAGAVNIEWKVFAHILTVPSDVIRLKAAHLQRDGVSYPLNFVFQRSAEEDTSVRPGQLRPQGPPRRLIRRPPSRLSAPAFRPAVTVTAQGVWLGERPLGKFEYCMTYVWGRGEPWYTSGGPPTNSATALDPTRYVPWVESPPCAVSEEADVEGGGTITMTLPNIDRMLGFDNAFTLRKGRAGLRKRIYVRRISDPSGTFEVRERFFLLDEVEGDAIQYIDSGARLPDLSAPLRDNHMSQQWELYPPPDQRYDLSLRVTLAPPRLETDTDAPNLPEGGMQALLSRTLMFLYESMGNGRMKRDAQNDYKLDLEALRKSYGIGKPADVPRRRRPARAGSRRSVASRYVFQEDSTP